MASISFFLSAGDPSGDNAASRLATELNEIVPDLSLFGLGGDKLKHLGQQQFAVGGDLAVLGFWEVAKRFRFFQRLLKRCVDEIHSRRPSCIILVDYPGFNLRLARRVRSLGIPIVYYISPQVWAWGRKRLREIKELVDLMLPILPFEQEIYDRNGINSKFVGHYLLEDIPAKYIKSHIPKAGHLALLPGSRPQEVERMLPSMLEAASMFYGKYGIRSVIAGVTGIFDYEQSLGRQKHEGVSVIYDDPRRVVYDSSMVLTSSGTATLEAAVIGRPMVVVYKTGYITYQIAQRLIKIDKIALVNLVLGEKVVPELIQHAAIPVGMFHELERIRSDEAYNLRMKEMLDRVPDLLGGSGASTRAARLIAELAGMGKD